MITGIAFGTLLTLTAAAPLQQRQLIPASPTCKSCKIVAQRVIALGQAHDTTSISNVGARVVVGPERVFYVAEFGANRVLVYDSVGRLLRTLGRKGKGPGEFQIIVSLSAGRDGFLYVFDYIRRLTVLDKTGGVVAVVRMPVAPASTTISSGGDKVLAGMIYSPAGAGLPLQLIAPSGKHVRSFGSVTPNVAPGKEEADRRFVCCAEQGRVWSAKLDEYVLEEWDLSSGKRKLRLERSPHWWISDRPDGRHATAPLSWIRGIENDSAGRLWVLALSRGAGWERSGYRVGYMLPVTPASLDAHFDSVIEVIDPVRRRLVASVVLPQHFAGFAGPGLLYRVSDVPDGRLQVEVWSVSLTR